MQALKHFECSGTKAAGLPFTQSISKALWQTMASCGHLAAQERQQTFHLFSPELKQHLDLCIVYFSVWNCLFTICI